MNEINKELEGIKRDEGKKKSRK
jgi:hypothetical protein